MSTNTVPHEGRFLKALGVNPDNVVANSTRLEWINGNAVLYFTAAHPLEAMTLAGALMAAAHDQEQTGPRPPEVVAEQGEPEQDTQEGDGGDTD